MTDASASAPAIPNPVSSKSMISRISLSDNPFAIDTLFSGVKIISVVTGFMVSTHPFAIDTPFSVL
jgi:hypothetical protein